MLAEAVYLVVVLLIGLAIIVFYVAWLETSGLKSLHAQDRLDDGSFWGVVRSLSFGLCVIAPGGLAAGGFVLAASYLRPFILG